MPTCRRRCHAGTQAGPRAHPGLCRWPGRQGPGRRPGRRPGRGSTRDPAADSPAAGNLQVVQTARAGRPTQSDGPTERPPATECVPNITLVRQRSGPGKPLSAHPIMIAKGVCIFVTSFEDVTIAVLRNPWRGLWGARIFDERIVWSAPKSNKKEKRRSVTNHEQKM